MERKFIFSEDEYYHIYNRGVDKKEIFTCPVDYQRFLGLLYLGNSNEPFSFRNCNRHSDRSSDRRESSGKFLIGINSQIFDQDRGQVLVDVGAYCLMPNHFHLLLKERMEGGISRFILKICTGYSNYFNKKYEHSGTLFQGPFKAEHLDTDNYLKYMYAYIHLNPVKLIDKNWHEKGIKNLGKAKSFLYNYKYSSYLDYLEKKRPESSILDKKSFPKYFSDQREFKDFVQEWLTYKNLEDN